MPRDSSTSVWQEARSRCPGSGRCAPGAAGPCGSRIRRARWPWRSCRGPGGRTVCGSCVRPACRCTRARGPRLSRCRTPGGRTARASTPSSAAARWARASGCAAPDLASLPSGPALPAPRQVLPEVQAALGLRVDPLVEALVADPHHGVAGVLQLQPALDQPGAPPTAQRVHHPRAQPVRVHAPRFAGLAAPQAGPPLRREGGVERHGRPRAGLQPPAAGTGGTIRSRWGANHRPRFSSRLTVALSRPTRPAVSLTLRPCSQCSLSIRIRSSGDRCE